MKSSRTFAGATIRTAGRSFWTLVVAVVPFLSIVSCSPAVHLIDRQTILEMEASGNWIELDDIYRKQALSAGPVNLPKTKDKESELAMLKMTHADGPAAPVKNENSDTGGAPQ